MPLSQATLVTAILRCTAPPSGKFPANPSEVGQAWSAAASASLMEMVLPPLLPGALAAGRAAMSAVVAAQVGVSGVAALSNGFHAFALAIAPMTLPPGLSVPPPAPPQIPALPPTNDPVAPAQTLAAAIFAWTKTGLYVSAPGALPVPWG